MWSLSIVCGEVSNKILQCYTRGNFSFDVSSLLVLQIILPYDDIEEVSSTTGFVLSTSYRTGFVRVDKESSLERCSVYCVGYVS